MRAYHGRLTSFITAGVAAALTTGCGGSSPTAATPVAGLASGAATLEVRAGNEKADVCHLQDEGAYVRLSVGPNAVEPHLRHGDGQPGGAVPGGGSVFGAHCESLPDQDGDLVADDVDNCPEHANPLQEDADGDGVGDACEVAPSCPAWDLGIEYWETNISTKNLDSDPNNDVDWTFGIFSGLTLLPYLPLSGYQTGLVITNGTYFYAGMIYEPSNAGGQITVGGEGGAVTYFTNGLAEFQACVDRFVTESGAILPN